MRVVDSIAALSCRIAVFQDYKEGRSQTETMETDTPPHWWGLRDALNRQCLANRQILPTPALWAELTPFLLVPGEDRALALLAEYTVYKTYPAAADIEWLGQELNPALHRLDVTDDRVVAFLEDAMGLYRPAWLALLSFETFRWVRRALDAAQAPRGVRSEWCRRGGPLWLKRGPGEVESEALGSLET